MKRAKPFKMPRRRPRRLDHIQGIGVDQMGDLADASDAEYLRLENLDVNIAADREALEYTERCSPASRRLIRVAARLLV